MRLSAAADIVLAAKDGLASRWAFLVVANSEKCDDGHIPIVINKALSANQSVQGCYVEHQPSMLVAVCKLAMAGEQAGFTVEQMIQLLNDGLTVESLLELIAKRLDFAQLVSLHITSSRWIM